ncbi:MAG: hypothetical protein ACM3ML_04840 [Micromonosporaceae bacterium]
MDLRHRPICRDLAVLAARTVRFAGWRCLSGRGRPSETIRPEGTLGPGARVEQNEAVSLAFITALQLLSPRANRRPALAVHTRDDANGLWHGSGLLVITVRGDQVAGLTRFESHTLRAFGLPRVLPGDDPA